ncbi:hypothetical protein GGP77_001662 [Salinibacter ruber]|uniref:hypothetical protein n=1 Tax=Salinibacter ruber TaxID=146919 RepID=UPI002169945F|nr:hypothetical protein [Salinibacter ruber]MCS3667433.1 hypothetical protein [Salinibacter ruber]
MTFEREDVQQLQEQYSEFLESIKDALNDDTAWEARNAAIVPAEEPYVEYELYKEKADFIVRAQATCEYGTAFHSIPFSKEMLADPVAAEHMPDEFVSAFQRMREEKAH